MATQTPETPARPVSGVVTDPMAQTLALLQPWIDYVPRQQRRLGIFIFLALLAHIATFFFIRIDTTRAELRHETRTHVTVENPQATAQERASGDGFWDRLTDPRVFLLPIGLPASLSSDMPAIEYASINTGFGPRQLPSPAQLEDYSFTQPALLPLDQRVATTLSPPRQPFSYNETPPVIAAKTTWQWDSTLAQRQPTGAPDLPSLVSDTDLSPTELRVAVSADGTVQHVIVEQSCGSGRLDLDQQAILAAEKIRFQRSDDPTPVWGRITVFWNYAPKPREEVIATPPSTP
jgi:hypothetical protein